MCSPSPRPPKPYEPTKQSLTTFPEQNQSAECDNTHQILFSPSTAHVTEQANSKPSGSKVRLAESVNLLLPTLPLIPDIVVTSPQPSTTNEEQTTTEDTMFRLALPVSVSPSPMGPQDPPEIPKPKRTQTYDDELEDIEGVCKAQGILKRIQFIKPSCRTICFECSASDAYDHTMELWRNWKSFGMTITQDDKKGMVMRARLPPIDGMFLPHPPLLIHAHCNSVSGSRTGVAHGHWDVKLHGLLEIE
jgi:hypothetical protein